MQKGLTLSANQRGSLSEFEEDASNSCIFQIVPRETPQIGDDTGRLERRGSDLSVWASFTNSCRLQGGTSGMNLIWYILLEIFVLLSAEKE